MRYIMLILFIILYPFDFIDIFMLTGNENCTLSAMTSVPLIQSRCYQAPNLALEK